MGRTDANFSNQHANIQEDQESRGFSILLIKAFQRIDKKNLNYFLFKVHFMENQILSTNENQKLSNLSFNTPRKHSSINTNLQIIFYYFLFQDPQKIVWQNLKSYNEWNQIRNQITQQRQKQILKKQEKSLMYDKIFLLFKRFQSFQVIFLNYLEKVLKHNY